MGMFDSVYAKCPKCGESVEFQSKADECAGAVYNVPGEVPARIAVNINGGAQWCKCGHAVRIRIGHDGTNNTYPMYTD